ncbi:MAG TPA: GNAT family N-acetyltransferase [Candidatus Absconditabacterales bacterium]|nr:GNAT family N-acetyltransferase [Candidatus Absconditabacterales bacterium]
MTTVRKAKNIDIPKIAKAAVQLLMYHAKLDPYFSPSQDAEEIYKKYFRRCIYSRKRELLVAEYEGEFAGYANIELASRPPVLKIRNMGVVNDIFVIEKFRKNGISKELFLGMLDWMKSKKKSCESLEYIELSVNMEDPVSQKVWAKYGFKEYMSKQRMKI